MQSEPQLGVLGWGAVSRMATDDKTKQMEYTATHHSRAGWCRYREELLRKTKMTQATMVSSPLSRPGTVAI